MRGPADRNGALAVVEALRDLGREERRLIEDGRFGGLRRLAVRRAKLLRLLDRALKPGWPTDPNVHAVLEQVRQEGALNLALLRARSDK